MWDGVFFKVYWREYLVFARILQREAEGYPRFHAEEVLCRVCRHTGYGFSPKRSRKCGESLQLNTLGVLIPLKKLTPTYHYHVAS